MMWLEIEREIYIYIYIYEVDLNISVIIHIQKVIKLKLRCAGLEEVVLTCEACVSNTWLVCFPVWKL